MRQHRPPYNATPARGFQHTFSTAPSFRYSIGHPASLPFVSNPTCQVSHSCACYDRLPRQSGRQSFPSSTTVPVLSVLAQIERICWGFPPHPVGFPAPKIPKRMLYCRQSSSPLACRTCGTAHASHPQRAIKSPLYCLELSSDPQDLRPKVPALPVFPLRPVAFPQPQQPGSGHTFYGRPQPMGRIVYLLVGGQGFRFRACAHPPLARALVAQYCEVAGEKFRQE